MPKLALGIGAALAAVLVAQSVILVSLRRGSDRLAQRLERLEKRLASAPSAPAAAPSPTGRTVPLPGESPSADGWPAPAPAMPERPLTPDELDGLIRRRVDQKVQEEVGRIQARDTSTDNGFGGKKRPLAEVAREISIDPASEARMTVIADEAKRHVFEVLRTPRPDGTNMVDELLDAMTSGPDPEENARAVFLRIFTETVPGTQETYFAVAIRISEDARRQFGTFLTPAQLKAYDRTEIGPLDLETGYDPFGEYWKMKSGK